MVTATVQCKRHQRERSNGNGAVLQTHPTNPRNRAVLQTHPEPPSEGRAGASGARRAPGAPSGNATKCQCLSAPLGCPHPPRPGVILPRDVLAGHLWGEGRWEWGWECCTWLDSPNPPCSHLGVASAAPPQQGHEGRAGFLLRAGKGGGGGCPGQAGTEGLCRAGTGWQKDPENLQANTVCRSITVIVAERGCAV